MPRWMLVRGAGVVLVAASSIHWVGMTWRVVLRTNCAWTRAWTNGLSSPSSWMTSFTHVWSTRWVAMGCWGTERGQVWQGPVGSFVKLGVVLAGMVMVL